MACRRTVDISHLVIYLAKSPKYRTCAICWRNDGESKENLHFDDQSEQVVSFFRHEIL